MVFLFPGGFAQPVAGTHESLVQGLLSSQFTAGPPVHTPVWQVSAFVQALLSLQPVPLVLFGVEQAPVAVLHMPMSWH